MAGPMTRSLLLEASASPRGRVEPALAFLLAVLPFCAVVRWPPNSGFWGQWLAVFVTLLWIALRLPSARAVPKAALALFALSLLLLLHSAAGLAAMPMATTMSALTLLIAGVACIATHGIEGSETREASLRAFGWGLIAALVLNAMVVVLGWLGY